MQMEKESKPSQASWAKLQRKIKSRWHVFTTQVECGNISISQTGVSKRDSASEIKKQIIVA